MADSPQVNDLIQKNITEYLEQHGANPSVPLYESFLHAIEYPFFKAVLEFCNYNQTHSARLLGISRTTLQKKIKRYDLLDPILLKSDND